MTIRPIEDRILVSITEPLPQPRELYTSPVSRCVALQGTVLSVGPGRYEPRLEICCVRQGRAPMSVKTGDVVLFIRYAGHPVPGSDNLTILTPGDILAVVVPD